MKKRAITNGVLFAVLVAVPLLAEYSTATPDKVPGTGFSVLLYEPFNYAYVLLAVLLFVSINIYVSSALKKKRIVYDVGLSIALTAIWFCVTFFAVGDLHLRLGGKL
jgi:hypothetical protein